MISQLTAPRWVTDIFSAYIDLLLRAHAEESHHGISGRVYRPVGFKTHSLHALLADSLVPLSRAFSNVCIDFGGEAT